MVPRYCWAVASTEVGTSSSGYHTISLNPKVSPPQLIVRSPLPTFCALIDSTWVNALRGGKLDKACNDQGNGNGAVHLEELTEFAFDVEEI